MEEIEPDLDCEYCGSKPPHECYHPDREESQSPGPHFVRRQCRWILGDRDCPQSLKGKCPECKLPIIGKRSKDGLYTYWKCQSCGWGDTQS